MIDIQKAAEYRLLLRQNPDNIALLKEAAGFFAASGMLDDAYSYITKYNELVADDAEALAIQGALLGRRGDHALAKEYLEKSLLINDGNADAHYNLALTSLNLGEISCAIEHLERATKLDEGDATAWNDLGVIQFSISDNGAAENSFHNAILANPNMREAHINLAQMGQNLNHLDRALTHLQNYLANHEDKDIEVAYESLRGFLIPDVAEKYDGLKVCLIAFSDFETDPNRKVRWGDYWFKKELGDAFEKLGCEIVHNDADLLVHLFGVPTTNLPQAKIKAIWIHSHPDLVTPQLLQEYDEIFCLSKPFISRIERMGNHAKLLVGGTAKRPLKSEKKYEIVFVGNTKGKLGRKIIADLKGDYSGLKVWGEGWENILPAENIGGIYYDNARLPELYASAKISLNDHHEDMRREGFLNPRVFDILASGGFVISDRMIGIEEIFGDAVPIYTSAESLRDLIAKFCNDDQLRERLAEKGRNIALQYSFDQMAIRILQSITGLLDAKRTSAPAKGQVTELQINALMPAAEFDVFESGVLKIGIDAQGRSDYEILPVINALELISDYHPNAELHIAGDNDNHLPVEAYSNENIKKVNEIDDCDIYVDCRLKFASLQKIPPMPHLVLTPNIEQENEVKGKQLHIKVESRIDLECGRIWEFNDLAFKLAFVIENARGLRTMAVK